MACVLGVGVAHADPVLQLQSTTSTQNSGLFDAILPGFTRATGIEVRVIAVGTGQALKNAANCDGDVVIVHARAAEDAFVEAGYGTERFDLMSNDFVIVGPADDPARIAGRSPVEALSLLAETRSLFVSRGDQSGTHRKELALWEETALDPDPAGAWYRAAGAGMGATLNMAVGMGAYTLSDRATWATFGNKGDLTVLVEGADLLKNPYGVIPVSPLHCDHVDPRLTEAFLNWILGAEGQLAIADFRPNGEQLFFPTTPGQDTEK